MGFGVLGTFRGAAGQMLAGVSDICLRVVDGVVQVFTATRAGGGILALELQAAGEGLALIDQQGIAAGQVLSAPGRLSFLTVGGQAALVWTGGWAADPGGWQIGAGGQIGDRLLLSGGPSGVVAAQAFAQVAGSGFAVLAPARAGVLEVWAVAETGRMQLRHSLTFGAAGQGFDVTALESLRIGGAQFILSLSAGEDALAVHRLRADGTLQTVSSVGASAGLGLAAPSALEVAEAGGRHWVFVAGAGSSSVSVLALGADGQLALTDHVIDTLDTRFQSVSALATAVVGDRVYVFAAGGDQGVQAFVLLPDGRLLDAGQQLQAAGLALDDITALEAVVRGGRIELVLGTEDGGLIRLRFDPGDLAPELQGGPGDNALTGDARGDLIAGKVGDDTLRGGAGADILLDGHGEDELWGGAGADVFVLEGDGDVDVIRDFEPGRDRIDLSGWGRVYAVEALPMAERRGVTVIRWGDEVLYIHSADGRNIDPALFRSSDIFGLWHVVAPEVEPGGMIGGSAGRDTLRGGGGDDTLMGSAGADRLEGGGGRDLVDYGTARAPLRADLTGGAGNSGLAAGDIYSGIEGLAGGSGADTLIGDGGDTVLLGRAGADWLSGGAGDDLLDGGAGADLLMGGGGADTLRGGAGVDTAGYAGAGQAVILSLATPGAGRGGAAGDVLSGIENLTGSRFADWLGGDGGANLLSGRAGNDRLEGGEGADTLTGGAGADTLQGGSGDDRLEGGSGSDWVSYDGRGVVRVDLALRGWQDTGQGRDWLLGIEHILSGAGADRLAGSGGANHMRAGAGQDRLEGRGGADWLEGGAGNDRISGGAGFDMALYRGAQAVRVDLAETGWQQTGQGRDRLLGIEGLAGGQAGDRLAGDGAGNRLLGARGADVLSGRGGDDTLMGEAGRDRLLGGAGNDLLNGGAGRDSAVFTGRGAVVVDLGRSGPQQTGAGRDTLRGIEDVEGGAGADRITGDGGANLLAGGAGNDRLRGAGGADQLLGGAGNDRLEGGAGADRLRGGAGADLLSGGGGADRFIFDAGRDRVLDYDAAEGDRIMIDSAVLRGAAGMTGAEVVARWGSDLGPSVALDFGANGRLLIEDLGSLAALARAIEVI